MKIVISTLWWFSLGWIIDIQTGQPPTQTLFLPTSLPAQAPGKIPSGHKQKGEAAAIRTGFNNPVGILSDDQARPIKFKHIGPREGLSQGHGVCIFQDSEGFMWFGTMDGLNKYDGYQMTVYRNNPRDTAVLSNNFITCIYEDQRKNLWVGTRTGLDRLDRRKGKFIHYKNQPDNPRSISNNSIHAIYEDHKGHLWLGTNGGGLNLYHPKEDNFTHYLPDPANPASISDGYVNAMYEDRAGQLWIGTGHGGLDLFDLASQSFTSFKNEAGNLSSLSNNNVTKMLEDRKGNFWVSTWGGGLNLFDRQKKTFVQYRHDTQQAKSLGSDIIYGMLEDRKGNLWVGTENGGLNLYNPATNDFIRYTHQINDANSLTNNTASALFEDTSGNIWVGIHRGGIDFFSTDGEKFRHYYQEVGAARLSNNNVKAFWEDTQGRLWVGTDGGGLNLFDRKTDTFTHYQHDLGDEQSISSDAVLAVLEDRQSRLWVATWEGGLNLFDRSNNTFAHYLPRPGDSTSISSDKPWVLWEDRKDNLWIGTYYGGLNRLDKKSRQFRRFQHDPANATSLCDDLVKAIAEDKEGNLWIGTRNGLDLLDPATCRFAHYRSDPQRARSLSNNEINALLTDRQGNLWVGTQQGLNRYHQDTHDFTVFTEKDGLCNNAIQGLLEDERGNLWISTLNGLSKFNPAQKTFQNFSVTDGLQGNEFTQNACLKAKDGNLFFGGNNGFNAFLPDSVKNNSFIPPVFLTDFQLFNRSVSISDKDSPLHQPIGQTKEIILPYAQTVIAFEFVALNYRSPEKNQYAYQLENFDEGWNFVGNQRKATYTNLDPGQYVFRVKASNNDGVWNEQGTSITLTITPPVWKTWWFKGGAAALVLALAWGAHRTRTRRITARNRALEARIRERTQQIEQQKEEIASQRDTLQLFNQEITHQKGALERKVEERTQELQASNEELLLITNALPVLITYVDQHQRYRFNNKTYEEWFGVPRSQVYGRHLSEVLGEKGYGKIKPMIEKTLAGETVHVETWMAYPRLGNRFVSIDYIPHWQAGRVLGYYALVSDITDQKKAKQALEKALQETHAKNQELKKINVDLDNFVYMASHDLKAPIANLEGIAFLLVTRLEQKLDETEREMMRMINLSTTKLKTTVNDLTEITKVQKNIDNALDLVSFEEILTDIQGSVLSLVEESGAVITTDFAVPSIRYARKNLRSVLYNLLVNALKYRSPDRAPRIRIQTQQHSNYVLLSVEDNGLGIASNQQHKLFTMFRRFHTHVEGTGIGLYITKRIIENNGGKIEVKSEEGKGTVFHVFFKGESAT